MSKTTYGDINQRTAAWAATEMLAHAEPILVLSKFGQNRPLPKNTADNVKFRRPVPFTVSTVPLVEGVTPTAQQMAYVNVQATPLQYGEVIEITDKVADMAEDPVLKDASTLAGEQAAETVELLTWNAIKAGTNIQYANGSARTDVNTVVSIGDIRASVRTLKANRGKAVTSMLSGSVNVGTVPVEGGFVAFGHTDLEADLRNITGFTPVAEYGSRKPLCPEEIGSLENVRFILSPVLTSFADAGGAKGNMKSTSGTSADVYPLLVIAKEAYGLVPLKGQNAMTPSVINPGTISKSDPLGQRGYVGWKTRFTAKILNEAWMVRIECAVTADANL